MIIRAVPARITLHTLAFLPCAQVVEFHSLWSAVRVGTLDQVKGFIPPLQDLLEEKSDRGSISFALSSLMDIFEVRDKLVYFSISNSRRYPTKGRIRV